jgi:acetoin utilization deacetylase AcuC-like enzyme
MNIGNAAWFIGSENSRGRTIPMLPFFSYAPSFEADIGPHVFPMRKYRMIRERLRGTGLPDGEFNEPVPSATESLLQVHTRDYLDDFLNSRMTPRTFPSELPISPQIVQAYLRMTQGTIDAARTAMTRGAGANIGGGFHHAFADHAEGFCYLNDVAVAIRRLQADGLIRRAAVVDCDVHQGNGTAAIFRNDPSVFTFSIHQENNYPIKQTGSLDIGLEDGAGDDVYLERLDEALRRIWRFGPEFAVYVGGADPYREDQLGGLRLSKEGLSERDRRVIEGCRKRNIPLCLTLAGGYSHDIEDTVEIHVETCLRIHRAAQPAA